MENGEEGKAQLSSATEPPRGGGVPQSEVSPRRTQHLRRKEGASVTS